MRILSAVRYSGRTVLKVLHNSSDPEYVGQNDQQEEPHATTTREFLELDADGNEVWRAVAERPWGNEHGATYNWVVSDAIWDGDDQFKLVRKSHDELVAELQVRLAPEPEPFNLFELVDREF